MFRCAAASACRTATKRNLTRHAHTWFTSNWRSSSTISSSKPRDQISGGAMGCSQWAGTSPAPQRSTRDGTLQLADTGKRSLVYPVSVWPVGTRSCSLPVLSDPLKGCNPRVNSEVGDERHPLFATIPPSWQGAPPRGLGCEVSPVWLSRLPVAEDSHEEDQPMLHYGLKRLHRTNLPIPHLVADRPDPALLQIRYRRFLETAG